MTAAHPVTRLLAEVMAGLSYERVPATVVQHVKACLLDTLGCGLYGATTPEGRTSVAALRQLSARPEVIVWGDTDRMDAPYAALVNATRTESMTMDDVHQRATVHPGSVVIPAALALAERVGGVDGKHFLGAVVAGYESVIRAGLTVAPFARIRGHHIIGIAGPVGAAVAAGHILGLTQDEMHQAIGLAATQGCGLMSAQFGAMVQRLHAGKAAHSGILSAYLARAGFTGIPDVFEAHYGGFAGTYGGDDGDPDRALAGLGEVFEAANVILRSYPCAGVVCTSIDGALALRAEYRIDPQAVAGVRIRCCHGVYQHSGFVYEPGSTIRAQMNIPYGVAVALLTGEATERQYQPDRVSDPEVVALSHLVVVEQDPEIDAMGAAGTYLADIEITLKDGRRVRTRTQYPKGSPANPLSAQEVAAKFCRLAASTLVEDQSGRIVAAVQALESVKDMRAFAGLLIAPAARSVVG